MGKWYKRRISEKTFIESYLITAGPHYYLLTLKSDLDLFVKYKTTGSVSKVDVRLDTTPPFFHADVKVVDDRSCSISHEADFNFSAKITPLSQGADYQGSFDVKINNYHDFFLGIMEGISGFISGLIGQLGTGQLCRCGGRLGKAQLKKHKEVYKDYFAKLLKSFHSILVKSSESIISKIPSSISHDGFISLTMPLTKLDTKSFETFIVEQYQQVLGEPVSDQRFEALKAVKNIGSLNQRLLNYLVEDWEMENPQKKVEELLVQLDEISNKLKDLAREGGEIHYNSLPKNPITGDVALNQITPGSLGWVCMRVPGEMGHMSNLMYHEQPVLSNEISTVYQTYFPLWVNLFKLIRKGYKIISLADILDLDVQSIETKIEEYEQRKINIDSNAISVVQWVALRSDCVRNKTPFNWEPQDLFDRLNNPQRDWTNPGRDEFRDMVDLLNLDGNQIL